MKKDHTASCRLGSRLPTRRGFLQWTTGLAIGGLMGCSSSSPQRRGEPTTGGSGGSGGAGGTGGGTSPDGGDSPDAGSDTGAETAPARNPRSVAIVRAESYTASYDAMKSAFDLLGGIRTLVSGKTVTIKPNLTGYSTNGLTGRVGFSPVNGLPLGESYVTHGATALALAQLLFENGATRVRFVESAGATRPLEDVVTAAGWDVNALSALGTVEFENTRNLGSGARYAQLAVPSSTSLLYDFFNLNHSYVDTDVFVSLSKLKQHATAGYTLCTKNIFGITPSSLYGQDAASMGENAVSDRLGMHDRQAYDVSPPGEKAGYTTQPPGFRVPRIITDLLSVRPIHLSVIDGVTTVRGGEGPWISGLSQTSPRVLLAGFNPIATDAAGVAIMGGDPAAATFSRGDNHLWLAQQAGLGTATLADLELLGLTLDEAKQYAF